MALEDARRYLARVVPWSGTDFVNIHYTVTGEGKRVFWNGAPCRGLDGAIAQLDRITKLPRTRDIYICLSSQRETETRINPKTGKSFSIALRSRENATALKSLYLDIDVKAGAYAVQKDALAGLASLISKTSLPKPSVVVASGSGGLHVYWCLAEALPVDRWQSLADALCAAAQAHGLLFDSQVTVDAARILRIPDTFNHKSDPPAPVKLLMCRDVDCLTETIEAALAPWAGRSPTKVTPLPPQDPNDELSAGITAKGTAQPRYIEDLERECPFVRDTLADQGASNTNPLWNLSTLLSVFLENGRDVAHWMASGHPGYTVESTDELFDRKEAENKKRNIGWPKCATIHRSGAPQCATCPHLQEDKTPLSFALPLVTNLPVPIAVPNGIAVPYRQDENGLIHTAIANKEGEPEDVIVFNFPIRNAWCQQHPEWRVNFETTYKGNSTLEVSLPFDGLADRSSAAKLLAAAGIPMMVHPYTQEFFMSWLRQLRDAKESVVQTMPFGWVIEDGKVLGFAYGGKIFYQGGDKPAAQPDPELRRQYTPKGESAHWLAAVQLINNQKRPDLDCLLASSFAAPLVRSTGLSGLVLGGYSLESGIGKTTTLKIAQAVWGNPSSGMQGLNDTQNSLIAKIAQLNSLPIFYDELKTARDTESFVNTVFMISGGREKSRQRANTTLRESRTWATLLTFASNESLHDFVVQGTRTTLAGLLRMFEFKVAPGENQSGDTATVSRLVSRLNENFGHAGLTYAAYLGDHADWLDNMVHQYQTLLEREWNSSNDERFWIATIAVLLCGAKTANRLGLASFDLNSMKTFLHGELLRMRLELARSPNDMSQALNVVTLLGNFLSEKRAHHTLITNRTWMGRGKPGKGAIAIRSDATRLQSLEVQVSVEDKVLRFTSTSIGDWLKAKGVPRYTFTEALKTQLGATQITGRMGSGTSVAGVTELLYQISISGTGLEDHVELDNL